MLTPRFGWVGVLCLAVCCAYARQNPPAGAGTPGAVPSGDRNIVLDVVATNKAGKPVAGLQQQDFTVLDNKQPQKLTYFRAVEAGPGKNAPPAEVILLVDGVNGSFANVANVRDQLLAFLKKNADSLPGPTSILLLTLSETTMWASSAHDSVALLEALNEGRSGQLVTAKSPESYGIEGSQQLPLYTLDLLAGYESKKPGRKLLIWISPGWPLLSDQEGGLSSKEQDRLFASIVSFSDKLRQARIAIYDIDPLGLADAGNFETTDYDQFIKGVKKPREVEIGDLGLQILATQTGGRVLNSSNDMAGEISGCIADSASYYVLAFPRPAGDGPNEYHSLEVKIAKSGVTARTRTGYYAQPAR